MTNRVSMRRRDFAIAATAAIAIPQRARAQVAERASTLVLAVDIADTRTLDPARQVAYTPPLTLRACYDTLVTFRPGDYRQVIPCLATSWTRTPDGDGWRFTLRGDAQFASGNRVRPSDCAFSLTRLLTLGDPPAHYVETIAAVVPSGDDTVDIRLKDPQRPILGALAAPCFAIMEQAAIELQNGTALPNAASADRATAWLDQHSAGSGAYVLRRWVPQRRIELEASTGSWRGTPGYRHVRIEGIADGTAQLRALQRGDVDAAFNLAPDQLQLAQTDPAIRVESVRSLDMVYLGLTADRARNEALARREARQAIGFAIDYDDLLSRMLGGEAVRPASFLPVGVPGSDAGTADRLGFRQDLDGARALLARAGLEKGFRFELAYIDAAIAGLDYVTLARKLRDDLGRVGIEASLRAMAPPKWRDDFFAGKLQSTLGFWTSPVVESGFWADAAFDRLAPRFGLEIPPTLRAVVTQAQTDPDADQRSQAWVDYQRAMASLASLLVLFQPSYRVAVRRPVGALPLTASGWLADLDRVAPRPPSPSSG